MRREKDMAIGGGSMDIKNNDEKKIKAEIKEVYAWSSRMTDKIYDELLAKGETPGLDTHREQYKPIEEECDRRIREILIKYGYREK